MNTNPVETIVAESRVTRRITSRVYQVAGAIETSRQVFVVEDVEYPTLEEAQARDAAILAEVAAEDALSNAIRAEEKLADEWESTSQEIARLQGSLRATESVLAEARVARVEAEVAHTLAVNASYVDPLGRQPGDVLIHAQTGQEWTVLAIRPRTFSSEYLVRRYAYQDQAPTWARADDFQRN